jgi:hypothetical protein
VGKEKHMAWHIIGTDLGPCSCDLGCPCILGAMEGDRGWCSAVRLYNIRSGDIDGVDVSGTKIALIADWPSGFLAGNGTGRLYFDPDVSQEQRQALEALITGQLGGVFEVIGALIPNFLPSREASITIQVDEEGTTRAKVGDIGAVVVKPLRGPQGDVTRLLHGAAAFRDDLVLADGTGTRFHDPELREWASGGHGEQVDFDWRA